MMAESPALRESGGLPVFGAAFSIRFAAGVYPSELIRREVNEYKAPPADRYRQARSAVLRVLLEEMRLICSSAVIQCCAQHPYHSQYMRRAEENRSRISRGRS